MSRGAALLVLLLVACGQPRRVLHANDPVTDFYVVSPGIYRGGRPDAAGVASLAKLGVKTIINLENDRRAIANEATWARAASVTELSMPMSGTFTPDDHEVNAILAVLADPSRRPIYVHCMKGMDRTGIVIALHRVINEGWTPAAAEAERDAIGFNRWLTMLDYYYGWKAQAAYHGPARLARR